MGGLVVALSMLDGLVYVFIWVEEYLTIVYSFPILLCSISMSSCLLYMYWFAVVDWVFSDLAQLGIIDVESIVRMLRFYYVLYFETYDSCCCEHFFEVHSTGRRCGAYFFWYSVCLGFVFLLFIFLFLCFIIIVILL